MFVIITSEIIRNYSIKLPLVTGRSLVYHVRVLYALLVVGRNPMSEDQQNIDPHAAALESLANGEVPPEDTDQLEDSAVAGEAISDETHYNHDSELAASVSQQPSANRKVRSANSHAKVHHAVGHQLKAMMVPLLLVSGILLFLLGGAAAFFTDDRTTMTKIAIFASFPLGAILLVGAWMFHHDVKEHNRNNGQ